MTVVHHHRRSSTRPIDLIECIDVSVHQLPRRLHADLQPDLHDAPHRPLVGLPPVPGAHAAGLPAGLMGHHRGAPGQQYFDLINSDGWKV